NLASDPRSRHDTSTALQGQAVLPGAAHMTAPGRDKPLPVRVPVLPVPVLRVPVPVRYAAVAAVCALCYGNALRGEFVHDDVWAIVNNPDVRPGSGLGSVFTGDFWGKRMADNTSHKSYRPLCVLSFKADVLACLLFLMTFLSYVGLLLGTCAMLTKETGVTVFGVCVLYDALELCRKPLLRHGSGSSCREFLGFCCPLLKRVGLISSYVAFIMCVRLWLMGGSMPLFSEQDNPASFSPHLLTRFLTYSYLLSFNAWLLLAPVVLCYDWQVGSIPLVESLGDVRNIATLLLVAVLLALCLRCAFSLQRVLYMPSMGYCILVVHGLGRLWAGLGRWGAAALSVSLLLLLLLFSLKTVQQNHTWLSREALFRSGIQTLPHNAKVHYNYANFLKDIGRYQEAVHHYTTALRLYPRHASAMNNLGTLTRHPVEAERYYRKALETNQQHNRALFNLANLLKSRGEEVEAEKLLADSIRYGPHFADAYSSLASLYAEQKRFAEANKVYQRGIEKCPDSSDLHNNYGVFLVDTGEGDRAAAHYQHAVRLKPAHYVAMVNLGRLLRSANDNKEAESWYKRALEVTRKVDILTPLGALYYNTGRYQEALAVYREAAALQPDSTDIWLALNPSDPSIRAELHFSKGNQLREMNQLDRAFQSYKLAVELKPDQSQAWMNMGGIQHIKGDYAAARMYYQRALLLNPASKLLQENLAKLDRLERRLTEGV
ncbi:hypothetical protein CRUP_025323, partial [Coryphaenoides rupestris]